MAFRKLFEWASGESRRAFAAKMHALEDEIFRMPLDDARLQVDRLLSRSDFYSRVVLANSALSISPDLDMPQTVREFFDRYERMEELNGDGRLDRSDLGRSAIDGRFIKIGTEIESSEIVVRPGAQTVYVIDSAENVDSPEEHYPSVYHYILFKARLLEGKGHHSP